MGAITRRFIAVVTIGILSGRALSEKLDQTADVIFPPEIDPAMKAATRLQREGTKSPFVFISERGAPFARRGFQAMLERAGHAAGFDMKIHPHMLRRACGFKLANDGVDTRTIQAYLGHESIQHTVRYTELAPTRFKSLFRD
jgi:site-specific recombinase XerD